MEFNGVVMLSLLLSGAAALSACSQAASEVQADEETAIVTETPRAEYAQKDGDTYFYVSSVSDEDKKEGKAASVVGFRNLGPENGAHRLALLADDGRGIATLECSVPCRVAKQRDSAGNVTRIAVEPTSILAAAFHDASRGLMEIAVGSDDTVSGVRSGEQNRAAALPSPENNSFREPDFSGRDQQYSSYRTRILEGLGEGVNFFRNYSLVRMGCGTGCTFNLLVDRTTGKVSSVPFGGEEYQRLVLLHSAESDLLDANWYDGEVCMAQQVRWNGARWESNGEATARPAFVCSD